MPTSDEVLDGSFTSGVGPLTDAVETDDLVQRAAAKGWVALVAEASAGKAAILDQLAATGRFPHWFGRNWDALSDCLVDLSWLPAEGYLVLVEGWRDFEATWPRDAAVARSVLAHAADEWANRGTPFVVLTR